MSADIDKAVKLLSELLGSDNEESPENYNEISDETDETEEAEEDFSADNLFDAFSGGDDKRITLLSSIKPYMNGKRQGKIDTAIQIVRLISLSSGLGLTNLFKQ